MRYAKDKSNKRGVLSIIYLKNFSRGKKMINTELDSFYIQQLITLRNFKNHGMSRMDFIGIIQ